MKNEDFKVAFLSRIMRRDNALQFFGGREGGFHDRKKKFKQKSLVLVPWTSPEVDD